MMQLDMGALYQLEGSAPLHLLQQALSDQATQAAWDPSRDSMAGVVWTPSMCRMYTLTDRYVLPVIDAKQAGPFHHDGFCSWLSYCLRTCHTRIN